MCFPVKPVFLFIIGPHQLRRRRRHRRLRKTKQLAINAVAVIVVVAAAVAAVWLFLASCKKKSCRNLAEKIRTPSAMRQTGLQQQQQQQRLDTDTHNQNLKLLFGFAYSTVKPTAKSFSGLGPEGSFICTGNCRSCSSRRKIPLQLAGILIRSLLLGVL